MPIQARKMVRKMRGGAQAHLLEASDGHFYVVKFLGNPQHRRVLTNEMIAGIILKYLQISSPETALIELTQEFLKENPHVHLTSGSKRVEVQPGWHFGSRYPGDPNLVAVYDFVPDSLLGQVNNLGDFLGCLVFDKWVSNADGRQNVFLRAPLIDWFPEQRPHPQKLGFLALMIDHGFVFNGPHWEFVDTPGYGLYMRKLVYERVQGIESFEPWLSRVEHFPDEVLDRAMKSIPPQWICGEEDELERLLERLLTRRRKVRALIEDVRNSNLNPFARWTK
jgi:hypothetical protein